MVADQTCASLDRDSLLISQFPNIRMSVNNFKAIFTLIIFLIAEILVNFPLSIPVSRRVLNVFACFQKRRSIAHGETTSSHNPSSASLESLGSAAHLPTPIRIPLNYVTAPVVAVSVLLAAGCIHGEQVRSGIVGSDGVEPLNVMALFICLAYMVLSVDKAGVLRYLAFWVASKSGSSGTRLYVAIYAFFFCVGTIIGNDPVILSGVPFLAYFTHETGINPPTAWIFAQFINANIASAVLVSSNPTNIVLSGAFSISYFVYTAKIILPVLAATIVTLPTLLLMFRDPKYIPRIMKPINVSPRSALVDPFGGIFSSTVLVLTLCTLVATSTLHPQLYQVAVPPAVLVLTRDILYDLRTYPRRKLELETVLKETVKNSAPSLTMLEENQGTAPDKSGGVKEHGGATLSGTETPGLDPDSDHLASASLAVNGPFVSQEKPVLVSKIAVSIEHADTTQNTSSEARAPHSKFLERRFPTVIAILKIMPFSLVLFSLSLFILIQGLAVTGWIDVAAGWWGTWTDKTGAAGAVFGMGLISCILCNIFGTNIGATILLARVLQVWIQASSPTPSPRVQEAAIYTLALGSNYGAFSLSFSASLAGLLWRKLLLAKGVKVTIGQFATLNFLPCAVAMGVSCCVLVGEIYVIHK